MTFKKEEKRKRGRNDTRQCMTAHASHYHTEWKTHPQCLSNIQRKGKAISTCVPSPKQRDTT